MVETLRHRGPDDFGHFVNGVAALGAARLSIIDVAGGHQPISIDNGAITVAQNGEIYNYVELRDELARSGRRCTTACDTEVIAHLYAREGVQAFSRMRGMFAVAIWDAPRQRLVLARDRVGKKPLYVTAARRRGAVRVGDQGHPRGARRGAARQRARAVELLHVRLRRRAGRDLRGHAPAEPGATLTIDVRTGDDDRSATGRGPSRPTTSTRPEEEIVEALRAELREAVRIRLRSDVPLGAFLSGGMDSAAVLALMTQHSSRPVKTFTIGFGDPAYDELDDARQHRRGVRRGSSRADRHARRHRRRRAAGACTTTSRSPTRRRFRRTTCPSSRGSTSRSACPAMAATSSSPATRRTPMRSRAWRRRP